MAAAVTVGPSKMAGGGDALIATRDLAAGEMLLSEEPLARIERGDFDPMRVVYERILEAGVEDILRSQNLWLGPATGPHALGYKEWADKTISEDQSRQGAIESMLAVSFNAYMDSTTGNHQVVYPTMSKANHSCQANTLIHVPFDGPGSLVCNQNVRRGDEVTVSYHRW
eukprot:TRINITY_DN20130_c0_g2_i2.p1 TRINITY_DN20130_c0_g2~~TRINITY_DN20130_c0_g2_i2.p1  ORF type:complete len:169 (+),score=12.40 TRINITY_DN20130_c0_g2_i2:74-580(+)